MLQCQGPYMPFTDDPIILPEIDHALRGTKSRKACGPSGNPPGVLNLLPQRRILFLCALFNMIFLSERYPSTWTISKLVTIFKRGERSMCDNYRGIVLMDS